MKTNIHFFILSCLLLLRMRNVSDRSCREIKKILLITYFTENHTIYKIMWKNILEPNRCHMTVGRMNIACYVGDLKSSLPGP